MSYTYEDNLNDAIDRWEKLPDGPKKDKIATKLLQRYQSMREHDVFWMRLPEAYPDWDLEKFPIKPAIPKEVRQ
jgi:hypothetical protein